MFQTFNSHRKSLSELSLYGKSLSPAHNLSILKGCTNLVSLSLTMIQLTYARSDPLYKDAFLEVVAWLKECKKLRILDCTDIFDGDALLTRVLSESDFNLISLKYIGSRSQETHKFHQALATQTSLQKLLLTGDMGEDPVDSDNLVESLSELVNLRVLCLRKICKSFHDQHVAQLARSLPKLEFLSMSGIGFTDAIWEAFSSLRSLQKLNLDALPKVTFHGILAFIEKLGPSNKGLVLAMYREDGESNLLLWETQVINETIANKVGGKFECEILEGNY